MWMELFKSTVSLGHKVGNFFFYYDCDYRVREDINAEVCVALFY